MEATNNIRRQAKKQNRSKKIMENTTGTSTSEVPTPHIAICNSGLSNGLTEEALLEHFKTFGQIESIRMLPGKSCCFISFSTISEAENAYNHSNGKLNIAQNSKLLQLSYTTTVPTNDFNISSTLPLGLIVIENFVSEAEEATLNAVHDFSSNSTTNSELKNRLVKHFGFEFKYDINNVDKDNPLDEKIPSELNYLWTRLLSEHSIIFRPNQLTINHYRVGNGIPPHIDTHSAFEDPIISLSLGSSIVMDFRLGADHRSVFLPRRSLAVISGECRYRWTHGITPRTLDILPTENGLTAFKRSPRTSFTFRRVRLGECNCRYHDSCDSFKRQTRDNQIDEDIAAKLESNHVHEVYENIADHFSETRHKPWPNVQEFVKSLKVGSILVDIGCGNGKYLGENTNIFNVGCDRSHRLLDVCQERKFNVFHCDCLQIPLRDYSADAVICIAVIHHLATEQRRLQSIAEMARVLSIGGRALIYVWAKDQCSDNTKSNYLMQDRRNRRSATVATLKAKARVLDGLVNKGDEGLTLPVHTNRRQFEHSDVLVPWKLKTTEEESNSNEYLRFYHVFEDGELEDLCQGLDNVTICKSYYDQGNWCIVLQKNK